MNEHSDVAASAQRPRGPAIDFTGEWREFLPIALTNLALTVATLGIYRFWAKARQRRYLWSRTRFVDDSLEWTGTGKEMLIGFLIVMAVLMPVLLFLNFGIQALILRGQAIWAGLSMVVLYAGLFYLFNVARFRALRYQLSRTYWHGIRGGSDDRGWRYGGEAMWRYAVGAGAMGMLLPWTQTRLWDIRWNSMSFGSHSFHAKSEFEGLMKRWLLIYVTPFAAIFILGGLGFAGVHVAAANGDPEGTALGVGIAIGVGLLICYLLYLLLSLSFWAAFYRNAAASTRIATVEFEFTARTRDWLKLILGHIGLVIVTLGFGLMFIAYRNWSFLVRHLEARGHLDLDELTQSETRATGDAEGLADAFDFGAV